MVTLLPQILPNVMLQLSAEQCNWNVGRNCFLFKPCESGISENNLQLNNSVFFFFTSVIQKALLPADTVVR